MRVSLGGSERRVAEYLLDGPQIRAAVQKMRGRGMAQIVRRYVGNTRARCEPVDRLAERARIEPPASRAEEQRPVGTHKELRPRRKICGEGAPGGDAEGNDSFFVAFAYDPQRRVRAQRIDVQRAQFADADARGVQEFDGGVVAKRERIARRRQVSGVLRQPASLLLIEHAGQGVVRTRGFEPGGGVDVGVALPMQPSAKRAD